MDTNAIKQIPTYVRDVSRSLTEAGFENFLVGGCVRDLFLNRVPKDWDITTIATPEEIQKLFPDSFYENTFGTVGVKWRWETEDVRGTSSAEVVEITPYRLESGYTDGRHPDTVEWAKRIEDDLARRDFTMNAIALGLEPHPASESRPSPNLGEGKGEVLIDPYGGREDIKRGLIKTVGKADERFQEDALRMFRAIRFASELGFAVEGETLAAIERNATLMENISKERIHDEFVKIIMSENPAIALDLAARLGLLTYISPEFVKGIGVTQNQAHAYTVWEHLLRSLNHAAAKGFPLHVRLAALFHDIAKPHTKGLKGETVTFYGHEVVGARLTKRALDDLKFPKEIIDKVWRLVRWHMFFSDTEEISLSAVRRMVRNVGVDLIWDLMDMRAADRIGTGRPKETPYRLRKYHSMIEQVMRDPISVKQLVVKGEDIMHLTATHGGPHIGFILEILLAEVLEKPELNTKEYLEKKVKALYALSPQELKEKGIAARRSNEDEDEREVEKIKEDYKVK